MIVKGVCSGDLECWCFNVTAEDYERVTGRKPEEWHEALFPLGEYRYSLYPDDLIKAKKGVPTTIFIECDITVPETPKR